MSYMQTIGLTEITELTKKQKKNLVTIAVWRSYGQQALCSSKKCFKGSIGQRGVELSEKLESKNSQSKEKKFSKLAFTYVMQFTQILWKRHGHQSPLNYVRVQTLFQQWIPFFTPSWTATQKSQRNILNVSDTLWAPLAKTLYNGVTGGRQVPPKQIILNLLGC